MVTGIARAALVKSRSMARAKARQSHPFTIAARRTQPIKRINLSLTIRAVLGQAVFQAFLDLLPSSRIG